MSKFGQNQQMRRDRAALIRTFPKTFMAKDVDKLPLKIGIRHDLRKAVVLDESGKRIPYCRLCHALNDYCWGPKYQRALAAGGQRVDLEGNAVGAVTEEHRMIAKATLGRILANQVELKEAA